MSKEQPAKLKNARLGRRTYKGAYIVAYTMKRKNAKRHILERFDDVELAISRKRVLNNISNGKVEYHVYNGVWEVIE